MATKVTVVMKADPNILSQSPFTSYHCGVLPARRATRVDPIEVLPAECRESVHARPLGMRPWDSAVPALRKRHYKKSAVRNERGKRTEKQRRDNHRCLGAAEVRGCRPEHDHDKPRRCEWREDRGDPDQAG